MPLHTYKPERALVIRHYGPEAVEDPDCTTSIYVTEDGKMPRGPHQMLGRFLALDSDAELNDLIDQLIAIRDSTNHITQPEEKKQ